MFDLVPFDYTGQQVRTILIDGEPWFVAADVCAVLDIENVRQAAERLDTYDRRQTSVVDGAGRTNPRTWIVSESGLYDLIIRSDKPEARPFRRWLTGEVLPQIRRTGSYGTPALPSYADALRQLADSVEEHERQARALEAARPAVEFHERFVQADGNYKVGDVAKALGIPGLGQNKLFALLRAEGVLISGGKSHNVPYQRHVDAGRFVVKVTTFTTPDGERASHTTYVTPRGMDYIRKAVESLSHLVDEIRA